MNQGKTVKLPYGPKIYLPENLESLYENFEPITSSLICEILRNGGDFVDVGANIGWYTVIGASILQKSGMVYSIEPNPDVLPVLHRNIEGMENITVFETSVGLRNGRADFFLTADTVNSGLYPGPFSSNLSTKIEVAIDCLDTLIANPGRVRVVKIDVQGDEIDVLRGAEKVLEKKDLTLICEWAPEWMRNTGADPDFLPVYLREMGFELSIIDEWLGRRMSIEEFYFELDKDFSRKRFCNILATK